MPVRDANASLVAGLRALVDQVLRLNTELRLPIPADRNEHVE